MKARAAAAASRTPSRARARPISWRRSTLAAGRGSSGSPTPAWAGEQAGGGPRPNSEEAEPSRAETQQRNPEAEQRNPERYQRKTFPRIGPFQWVTTISDRKRPPPCRVRGRLSPTILKIARNSDFHKEFRRRRHQGVMAGLVPAAIPERPSTSTQAKLAEKPCDRPPSCPSRRGGTRSCGGPAWMAGTSPGKPMTARVRRTNSKPVDEHITP